MSAPHWIDRAIADRSFLNLDHVDGRTILAEAVLAAVPKAQVVDAIRTSALAVLLVRFPNLDPEQAAAIARELANNATQTVLFALEAP